MEVKMSEVWALGSPLLTLPKLDLTDSKGYEVNRTR